MEAFGMSRKNQGRPTAAPEQSVDKVIFKTENVGAASGRPQCESYVFAGIRWKNLCFTAGPAMLAPTVFVEKSFFNTLAGRIWPFRYFYALVRPYSLVSFRIRSARALLSKPSRARQVQLSVDRVPGKFIRADLPSSR